MKTNERSKPVVVLCSGGLDSVTLAYQIHSATPTPEIVLFGVDYGQRHKKELHCAKQVVKDLVGVTYVRAHLEQPIEVATSSALFKEGAKVPDGHYASENMKVTVGPNRNAILLSLAWAHAVAIGATSIYAAMHAGDRPIYHDCRPVFIKSLNEALFWGTQGFADPELRIVTPYIELRKHDIVRIGAKQLDVPVPYEKTWSCYKGRELHCGQCDTCVERKEAFNLALVDDPTKYENSTPIPGDITLNFGRNY